MQVRRALDLASADALSPWESRLRMLYVVDGGFDPPGVNAWIRDRRTGLLIGRADLVDVDAGLMLEFDGAHHRDRHQHNADNHREEIFEALGLIVVRVDSLDFRTPDRLLDRIAAARSRGLRRDRDNDCWVLVAEPLWSVAS